MSRNTMKSFWQSPLWSEILVSTHQACIIPYRCEDVDIILERRTIFWSFTGLYVLGIDPHLLTQGHIQHLRSLAQKSDLFLQVEPMTYFVAEKREERKEKKEGIEKAPFRRFIEPVTAILRLWDISEEALLQSFKEKWRYNIRLAERRGLTTQWVRGDDVSTYTLAWKNDTKQQTYAEIFFQLLEETTERDGFAHNTLSYYRHFLKTLEKHNAGGLLIALQGDTIHAAGIFVYWDHHAIYYYGASSSDSEIRRDKGTHLLQWHAIQEAMRRKCDDYDFLGISSSEWDKLAGVTRFKMQFNPEIVSLPTETVIVLRPILLKTLQIINCGRKLLRKYF